MIFRVALAAIMVASIMGVVALTGILPTSAQSAPSATRSFNPATVAPGGTVTVTIQAADYGLAGGVTETLPTGFAYVSSPLAASQVTELSGNQVRFTLQGEASFTYTVTASGTAGSHTFSGTLRDIERDDYPVGGVDTVTVRPPQPVPTPKFASATDTREVAENTAAGENVGDPVTAMDADDDTLNYTLGGTDAASFDIDPSTGQLMTKAALDYEAKASYVVTVTASDSGGLSDSIDVTITVTNVDEMGEVTLWASATDALTMAPQVGETITGAVMDPDNPDDDATVESWQWARTMDDMDSRDMDSWMPITGETNAAYTVTEGDTGYYLRVMATYTDAVGTDVAMEYSPATMIVTTMMTAPIPLLVEYDPDGDGVIEKADMRRAVGNFFGSEPTLSRAEMRRLVGIYFR